MKDNEQQQTMKVMGSEVVMAKAWVAQCGAWRGSYTMIFCRTSWDIAAAFNRVSQNFLAQIYF